MLAVAVIEALAPTLTVATAKAFDPLVPVMCRIPSFIAVAAATMSGTGVDEADSNKVLSPVLLSAASTLAQSKPNATVVGTEGAWRREGDHEALRAPAAIDTGVLGEPVSALVAGLVVW